MALHVKRRLFRDCKLLFRKTRPTRLPIEANVVVRFLPSSSSSSWAAVASWYGSFDLVSRLEVLYEC